MPHLSRRLFLELIAGSGAAAAVTVAGKSVNTLIPYVVPPEFPPPATWAFYATVCRECPAGCGMHLWHRDGRVTKAEGNPAHPVNRGALCPRGQSCVQGLYDPDRLAAPRGPGNSGAPDWKSVLEVCGDQLRQAGANVAILSDLQTGAMANLLEKFAATLGSPRLLMYEPFNYEPLRRAHDLLYGLGDIPDYRLDACEMIVSFSADFLESWISPVGFARRFAEFHSCRGGEVGRFVYVGPRMSQTAANADEFIQVPPGSETAVALALLKAVVEARASSAAGRGAVDAGGRALVDADRVRELAVAMGPAAAALPAGVKPSQIERLARLFSQAKGAVALAGPTGATGPRADAIALAAALLNHVTGNVGKTVDFARPHALSRTATARQTEQFLDGLTKRDVLIVLNANPAYTLPAAAEKIRRAGTIIYLGTMLDETARLADWVLPIDSPLELWGDYEPTAGVCGLVQPTMSRLLNTRHAGDVLLGLAEMAGKPVLSGEPGRPAGSFVDLLRARWEQVHKRLEPSRPFEEFWTDALRRGGAWEDLPPGAAPKLKAQIALEGLARPTSGPSPSAPSPTPSPAAEGTLELWVWPTGMLFDGRVSNRGWLQENPDPTSYIAWDTWIELSAATAGRLGVQPGDVVRLEASGRSVEAAVHITDDVADGVAAVPLGQGHTALGRNAANRGANAFVLLDPAAQAGAAQTGAAQAGLFRQVTLAKTSKTGALAYDAATQMQYGREIVQWVNLSHLRTMKEGEGDALRLPLPEGYKPETDLYKPHAYPEHRWAMVADLQRCIGCGACAVACYAENNLPVMGHDVVRRGLGMPWLKVVPYRDDANWHRLGFLPLMCQQCDAAPCEPVCPVYASVHNDEGLNAQVYNRCIGTRYCSNNCPYKVRRFNWLNVDWPKPLDWQLNPEVTVRVRGVMEKCTFCIQRIRQAEYRAKREGRRPLRDGEVQPACAQTCPTRALVFGDLLDDDSQVSRLTRTAPRRYHVLENLNTKPAVTYLRRIRLDDERI